MPSNEALKAAREWLGYLNDPRVENAPSVFSLAGLLDKMMAQARLEGVNMADTKAIISNVQNVLCQATNPTQDIKVRCPNCKRDITESPRYVNREHLLGFCIPGKLHYDEYLTENCEEGRHENCGGSPVFSWNNLTWGTYGIQVCPCQCHREQLGRLVREQWVRWATEHPQPKPSWLLPYEQLSESDKEADKCIGEGLLKTFLKWVQFTERLAGGK